MSISITCDRCFSRVTAVSEQYLELEMAFHQCPWDGDGMGEDTCTACATGVPHTCVTSRRSA